MRTILVSLIIIIAGNSIYSQDRDAIIFRTYEVPMSRQGVALDSEFFYVINNSSITKHRKSDGEMVVAWEDEDSLLLHLNSGSMVGGKLYVVNSNYPEYPMASSIEVFDPSTLKHIDNHSFGVLNGSATWMNEYEGFYYVGFAHYTDRGSEPGKTNSWTRLVKFDSEWRQIESWIFPRELIERFGSRSNSGGVILSDGRIICTGHDNFELYVLGFPDKGYTLNWKETIPAGSFGQGIAYEKKEGSEYIWGIVKKENKVVVTKL